MRPDLGSAWAITPIQTICFTQAIKFKLYNFWDWSCSLFRSSHGSRRQSLGRTGMACDTFQSRNAPFLFPFLKRVPASKKPEVPTPQAPNTIFYKPWHPNHHKWGKIEDKCKDWPWRQIWLSEQGYLLFGVECRSRLKMIKKRMLLLWTMARFWIARTSCCHNSIERIKSGYILFLRDSSGEY